jgi:hypothetical protein
VRATGPCGCFCITWLRVRKKRTIDSVVLYAANGDKIASVTPLTAAELGAISTDLSTAGGTASLSLPTDPNVLIREQTQQVFIVIQYHFGTA